ncbi:MAG TPA: hypothetical protein VH306_05275 [Gaiellaceae bacterium]
MGTTIVTLDERPGLADLDTGLDRVWPEFLHHGAVTSRLWGELWERFLPFQLLVLDDDGAALAKGHTIPFAWDGLAETLPDGVDGVLEAGVALHEAGGEPTTLSALVAIVSPRRRGEGLSGIVIEGMRAIAARHGLVDLVAPIRPTWKHRYPLTPFERYVEWRRHDGLPFDPWQRLHQRLGGEPLAIAWHSLVVSGSVAEWEDWTGLAFPESGPYVVPDALVPVEIDRAKDVGRYDEPNLWMRHRASLDRGMPPKG